MDGNPDFLSHGPLSSFTPAVKMAQTWNRAGRTGTGENKRTLPTTTSIIIIITIGLPSLHFIGREP
jgi:hypothetical protein